MAHLSINKSKLYCGMNHQATAFLPFTSQFGSPSKEVRPSRNFVTLAAVQFSYFCGNFLQIKPFTRLNRAAIRY